MAKEVVMTHSVAIHALMVSWYPMRRSSNPTGDVIMYLEPWTSPGVVEVVEEPYESPWHVKKILLLHEEYLKEALDPHLMA